MGAGRIFLLSPANCGGRRARQIVSPDAAFTLADQLRSPRGAPLGEVFSFVSGLYFRGKLTYARRFAASPDVENPLIGSGIYIITPCAGLRTPDVLITQDTIETFAGADVDAANAAYREPLERSARLLASEIGEHCDVVLLGSIASSKYVDILLGIFGERLVFPADFVGRGDMSRGGLLLRKAAEGVELDYVPVGAGPRRGSRPPKLPPLRRCLSPG